jgi:UPF0755 protein
MARSHVSLRFLVATAVLALLPLAGGWWAWKGQGPLQHPATVLVCKGMSLDQVADQMARDGVIRSAALFKLWARARNLQLIRGEYTISPRASLADVAGKLRRGEIHYTPLVVPDGITGWGLEKRLQGFIPEEVFWKLWRSPRLARIAGFPDAKDLEGLVAPATYRVNHAMEPEEILLLLVEAFHNQVRPRLEGGPLPPYQTLILASLVEKETHLPEEQPRVAGVYLKRLRMGMRLQCDPTSLYARWISGDLVFTPPTPEDVHRPSPFNTYTVAGLPPTPIAIPSPSAIAAAKTPEVGKDLYFVATGRGGHAFAPTLSQHNRNVNAYRRELARQRRAARG